MTYYTGVVDCIDGIEWGLALAFNALVEGDRTWVNEFCMYWGACQ